MKRIKKILLVFLVFFLLPLSACTKKEEALPLPEDMSGIRGEMFHIDKNINEETIDNYLNRDDCAYFDMRMLDDPANYEAIGGDSRLSGLLNGFEIVPYPYLCDGLNLPEDVLPGYEGRTLFHKEDDGTYSANYAESDEILSAIFPKDKAIILMCGGGGYAGMTKEFLIAKGYDANKIYNAGGFWYYKGENAKQILKEDGNFDLSEVNYQIIDFDTLTLIQNEPVSKDSIIEDGEDVFVDVDSLEEIIEKQNHQENFLLYLHLPGCLTCASFTPILRQLAEDYGLKICRMNINITNETENFISEKVAFAPSLLVFIKGNLVDYLDAEDDCDIKYYHDYEGLKEYITQYIQLD